MNSTHGDQQSIGLSVILPAYNEAAGLAEAVAEYLAVLPQIITPFEILIIDDCSSDSTFEVATDLANRHETVRIIRNPKNLGQVGSILQGFAQARYSYSTHNGVDLPFAPSDTTLMVDAIRHGADVVVVERTNRQGYSLDRKLMSWCNIGLTKLLLKSPVVDHNFVQAYSRNVLEVINVETSGVSTVTTELIIKAIELGYDVRRVPAIYHARRSGKSTITLRKAARSARELFRLALVLRHFRRSVGCRTHANKPHSDSASMEPEATDPKLTSHSHHQ